MAETDTAVLLYGTTEQPPALRHVEIGPLSFLYSNEGLRRICWHGTELVRGISWPIRDEDWGTYVPEIRQETIEEDQNGFRSRLTFAVDDGALLCDLRIEANDAGEIRTGITMTPGNGSFVTNRAGFTVLHPIRGVAGAALRVTHSDGTIKDTRFPQRISPGQPVMDIAGLAYGMGGATVEITFEGETFEMEDQRNWSDASYKTYCVPLVHPFRYTIDRPVTQTIHIALTGEARQAGTAHAGGLAVEDAGGPAPAMGLALEPGWTVAPEDVPLIARCGAAHLLLRVPPEATPGYLSDCAALAETLGAEVDAEIVLAEGTDAETGLRAAARALAGAGLTPARVLALPAAYLASHQPSGPWPDGPAPADVCRLARRVFPDAAIGGGMMTNFTEFNRCPPDPAACDYIAHGSTAIVHASDDLSLLETLETLPQIMESAETIGDGRPYRLGLVSIGMRSNPYGAAVAGNPDRVRRTMARDDPRQDGLFAAAWAMGVLAASAASRVEALCLAAPAGPFGLLAPAGDRSRLRPLFHVVRQAGVWSGADRLAVHGLPAGIAGYGVRRDGACHLMLANLSDRPRSLPLGRTASVAVLNTDSFAEAAADPVWIGRAGRETRSQIDLGPYATAFVSWPG